MAGHPMSDITEPLDRVMRLRYAGTCRVCLASLEAGTTAVYERSRRSVRCTGCRESATPEQDTARLSATATTGRDELKLRAPASAVIAETLRAQAAAPVQSGPARLFGRSPLTDDSRSWYLGALGELEVARELERLGEDWCVIHAVPVGTAGSDIDHLVIGPGGVFTINAKYHEGKKLWVGSRRLLVNGQRTDHLRNAAYESKRVAKILSRATGRAVSATSVIAVVAAQRITVREKPSDVVVMSSPQLPRWFQRRPAVLSSEQVTELRSAALNLATWGYPALPAADLTGFAALRERVAAAKRRRMLWGTAILLIPFAVAAGALFLR